MVNIYKFPQGHHSPIHIASNLVPFHDMTLATYILDRHAETLSFNWI